MTEAEVIVVGGGHNGLICAAYLARAGIDTLLVEARSEVGGAASTVSDLGARFNICNCDHTMIRAMPIVDELELASHGLEYLFGDASFANLFYDDDEPWSLFYDSEATIESIRAAYPSQAEKYRKYLDDAVPVAELAIEMARTLPTTPNMMATLFRRKAKGAARLMRWSRRSAESVMAEYFDDWHLTAPAASLGPTVWGIAPDTPGSGLAALGFATRHLVKTGRPKGGSGSLTGSILASFIEAGGRLRTDSMVNDLIVKDASVVGLRLSDGTRLDSKVIVAACDPNRVLLDWLDSVPPSIEATVERLRRQPTPRGYESKIDAVLNEKPVLRVGASLVANRPGADPLDPTIVVSPPPEDLAAAHKLRSSGRVADRPTLLSNVPSVRDPSLRPSDGQHVLSVEVLLTPYDHPGGWANSDEPERWLDLWEGLVQPGARQTIEAWRAMTPDRYEAEFQMHKGHTPSYSGSPLAALIGLNRSKTRYRTPIKGLYLSGAGTFPGAGVFGAPGRNTAAVVERDVKR